MEINAINALSTTDFSSLDSAPAMREVDLFRQAIEQQKVQQSQSAVLGTPSAIGEAIADKLRDVDQNYKSAMGRLEEMLPEEVRGPVKGADQSAGPFSDLNGRPGATEQFGSAEGANGKSYADMSIGELMEAQKNALTDTMSLQYQLGKVTVEEALVSSVAGKATRNLEMLLRGQ